MNSLDDHPGDGARPGEQDYMMPWRSALGGGHVGWLRMVIILLGMVGLPRVCADDMVVMKDTSTFILDTRLVVGEAGPGNLVVQAEAGGFVLDTRVPAGLGGVGGLMVVQVESDGFVLDTRVPVGGTR